MWFMRVYSTRTRTDLVTRIYEADKIQILFAEGIYFVCGNNTRKNLVEVNWKRLQR